MRYLLIVNPASGGGRSLHRLKKALRFFRRKGDEVVVYRTLGPGNATEAVRQRLDGFDAVIAAGGDGTLHEVAEALAHSTTPLGILPWGTGNVFAREMGLPRRTKALCRVIRRGRTRTIDLGSVDGRPFLMMASVGLDAFALGTMADGQFKRFWGMGAYALAGLGALVTYPHRDVEVTLDDSTVDRGGFVLISNTKLYGAFFVFHPQAHPSDGFLDVLVFRHSSRWQFLGMVFHMVWRSLWHRRSNQPAAFLARHGVYRTKTVTMTSSVVLPVQADGEFLPGGAKEVKVLPAALRVLLD